MTRGKTVLLSMVAVFVVSIGMAATASAALRYVVCEKVTTGGHWKDAQCSKAEANGPFNTKEVSTSEVAEGTSGVSRLKSTLGATKVIIRCSKDTFKGEIESGGKSKGKIVYEECVLENETTKEVLTKCTVPNITAKVKDELIETAGNIEDRFSEEGGPFAEFSITGSECALKKNNLKVTGSQICELPGGQAFAVEQTINCLFAGSSLKLESATAEYEGKDKVHLVSGRDWQDS